MANAFAFELGTEVRDRVTGYTGVVTGRCQHLTGCNTYGVLKLADDKGDIADPRWLDEQRLALVDVNAKPIELPEVAPTARGAIGNPKPTREVR